MILRKPYAFLIKNFKLLHLLLSIFLGFILYKSYILLQLFSKLVDNIKPYGPFDDLVGIYIGIFVYVFMVLAIVFSIIVILLLRQKKKPTGFYYASAFVYVAVILVFIYVGSVLGNIQFQLYETRTLKIIHDIILAAFVVQIPFLLVSITRAIGINVGKKFNFKKDVTDLEIDESDNAEFEFELNVDTEELKTKFRKRIRNIKYMYKENKLVFLVLASTIIFALLIFIVNIFAGIEKTYSEQEKYKSNFFEVTVLNSYLTNKDYRGKNIHNKYSYVVVRLRIKNISKETVGINIENTRVRVDTYVTYKPTIAEYDSFIEFGMPYYGQKLKPNEMRDVFLVYEIDREYSDRRMQFEHLVNASVVNNEVVFDYKKVALNHNTFNEVKSIKTANVGEAISFSESLLQDTVLKINSVIVKDRIAYIYNRCEQSDCNVYSKYIAPSLESDYDLTIVRFNYSLEYSNQLDKRYKVDSFIAKFGDVRYIINGKEYNNKIDITDVTPIPLTNDIYLEMTGRVKQAEKVYLDITIRDKKYSYLIIDNTTNVEIEKEEIEE